MNERPRVVLIHATRVAIDPIEAAARKHWPQTETVSILEEGLAIDRAKSRELSQDLHRRIVELTRYAENARADGVLFTCSAFGAAIEQASRDASIPVAKPNAAMFEEALSYGERITMIYTFAPAAAGMEREFKETATARGSNATLKTILCEGALAAKNIGDDTTHNRLIADTAARIHDAEVILLGQFSMATALDEARKNTQLRVLTSAEAAIKDIRRRVEAKGGRA